MRKRDKLDLEIRAKKAEINKLLELEDLDAEQRGQLETLTGEVRELETQYEAAVVAEPDPPVTRTTETEDAEARELRELRGRVRVGAYIAAASEMRAVAGAEAEYNQALEMGLDRFPLELLAAPETRATTDAESTVAQQSWLDRLFADTAAARLGISMRSVAPGVASFPITTAGATAAQRARAEVTADAAWAIATSELKPSRNAVRAVFTMEDAARLPGLEDALRRDLGMALAEGVDRAIFVGDATATGTDADIAGLSGIAPAAGGLQEKTLTQANKVKADKTLEAFAGLVDGIHAGGLNELRIVAAIGAWNLWETTVLSIDSETASVFRTLAQFLRDAGLSWSSRGGIEAATTNNKMAAFVGRSRGIEGAGVAAVWSAGQLIRDPYSGAAKGEIALTLNYLWAFGLPRPASFARVKFVT